MSLKDVAIIGGGVAGISASLVLADIGFAVHIIERDVQLGGHAVNFACKATDKCSKCLVCLADELVLKAFQHPKIKVLTGSEVTSFSGKSGNFELQISQAIGEESLFKELILKVGAVVIATGFMPFNAEEKKEYGYGKYKNVITALELEKDLRLTGKVLRPTDGAIPKKIAFFQCVGSRDESIGRGYCSKVCCPYALRLSKLIKSEIPESDVTIFYMDVQPAGKCFNKFRQECEELGIHFVRNLPSKVYGYVDSDFLRVKSLSGDKGEVVQNEFDLVVLSVGMSPQSDARFLADTFGVSLDRYGFFEGQGFRVNLSNVPGIFLAGACQGPKDIEESIVHGKAAAVEVARMLRV
ncbi:FAD-dependent oxidoreductase [Candidatus Oleimmundimicrobium sp.]|uniref:FAD-dependent oxidoreductase n=1 Tax=Candidatus Oleimmundimicrobium sp. TaxID=3060597 RepID=UPI00271E65AE|nr:FAD-dependent oxidoreductase [Candidatus Oleimmundimicrobium sp.]MDO8886262.1 FAD-dependent oxidoreductase [Candidatus Oleimmundimicrobium sp.]